MRKIFIALLLMFISCIETVSSVEILSYTTHLYFYNDELTKEVYMIINTKEPLESFTYVFSGAYGSLEVFDEYNNPLKFVVDMKRGLNYVTVFLNKNYSGRFLIKYIFKDMDYSYFEREENGSIFKYYNLVISDIIQANVLNYTIRIYIDKGYKILDIVPYTTIGLENDYYLLEFSSEKKGIFKVAIFLKRFKKTYPNIFLPIFIVPIFLILLVIIIRMYLRKIRFEKVTKGLRDDEIYVLKIIMKHNGIEQKKIEEMTNFSKAKVSKILSELERRGLIRKERVGNRNKLYINF